MSPKDASVYWRIAGMTYLKYANLCAQMTRTALKEPLKSKVKAREAVTFKQVPWAEGKPGQPVMTDSTGTQY